MGGSVGVFELSQGAAHSHTPNPSQPFQGSWYPVVQAPAMEIPEVQGEELCVGRVKVLWSFGASY